LQKKNNTLTAAVRMDPQITCPRTFRLEMLRGGYKFTSNLADCSNTLMFEPRGRVSKTWPVVTNSRSANLKNNSDK